MILFKNKKIMTVPKAFNIKETDSIKKIDKMQKELKETIDKLQTLYNTIQDFRDHKAFKEAFDERRGN